MGTPAAADPYAANLGPPVWPSGPHDPGLAPTGAGDLDPTVWAAFLAAPGFLPEDEGLALHAVALRAAAARPDLPLLEIGTYCGRSTVLLAEAARRSGTVVATVDHHRGSEENQPGWQWHDARLVDPVTGRLETAGALRRTLHAAGVEDTVVAVMADSALAARVWQAPVGLVFLDGNHTEAIASRDYATWVPHLVDGGLLAIHDVYPDPAEGGRPPWNVYQRARAEGFTPVGQHRSLRVLRRT